MCIFFCVSRFHEIHKKVHMSPQCHRKFMNDDFVFLSKIIFFFFFRNIHFENNPRLLCTFYASQREVSTFYNLCYKSRASISLETRISNPALVKFSFRFHILIKTLKKLFDDQGHPPRTPRADLLKHVLQII